MRLLLDTHVLLGLPGLQASGDNPKLGDLLHAGDHDLVVSVASLWEIAIKWRLGKLPLFVTPDTLPGLLERIGIGLLPVSADHVLALIVPQPPTRDPFDRLLLGVCQCEGLRLLTIDRALVGHPLAAHL